MHDIFSRDPDPLDGMLHPPAPPDNEMLRQAVYLRTRHVLQRRRRVRQFAYAAALLMSFAAGLLAMHVATPLPTPVLVVVQAPPQEPAPLDPQPARPSDALAQEWQAFDAQQEHAALYRQAGERYLTEENDLQSALRCYSNALDNGSEQDLTISSDDSWLLMAIKDARLKEKNYANQGG